MEFAPNLVFTALSQDGQRLPRGVFMASYLAPEAKPKMPAVGENTVVLIVDESLADKDTIEPDQLWTKHKQETQPVFSLAFLSFLPNSKDFASLASKLKVAISKRSKRSDFPRTEKTFPAICWIDQGLNTQIIHQDPKSTFLEKTSVWFNFDGWIGEREMKIASDAPDVYHDIANLRVPFPSIASAILKLDTLELQIKSSSSTLQLPIIQDILHNTKADLHYKEDSPSVIGTINLSINRFSDVMAPPDQKYSNGIGFCRLGFDASKLNLLDVCIKYFIKLEAGYRGFAFNLFEALNGTINLWINPVDVKSTFFDFNLNGLNPVGASLKSTLRTSNNEAVSLIPTIHSRLKLVSQPVYQTIDKEEYKLPYYLAPCGVFNLEIPNNRSKSIEIVCGLAGTETIEAKAGTTVHFVPDSPAVFERYSTTIIGSKNAEDEAADYKLKDDFRTTRIALKSPESIAVDHDILYKVQAEDSPLFEINKNKTLKQFGMQSEVNVLTYKPLCLRKTPALPPLAIVPFAGFKMKTLASRRKPSRAHLEQAKDLCGRVLGKLRIEDVRTFAKSSKFEYRQKEEPQTPGLTPQGWLCKIETEPATGAQTPREITFSQRALEDAPSIARKEKHQTQNNATKRVNRFRNEEVRIDSSSFAEKLLDKEIFAVVTALDQLKFIENYSDAGGSGCRVELNGWRFVLQSGQAQISSNREPLVIIKSSTKSIEDLCKTPSNWTQAPQQSPIEDRESIAQRIEKIIEKIKNNQSNPKRLALYQDLKIALTSPSWNGLLYIDPQIEFDNELSGGLDILLGKESVYDWKTGENKPICAIGLGVSKSKTSDTAIALEDTSIFAVADFERDNVDTTDGGTNSSAVFGLTKLAARFANSSLQSFEAIVHVVPFNLFDIALTNAPPIVLQGSFSRGANGKGKYSFASENLSKVLLGEDASTSILKCLNIKRISFCIDGDKPHFSLDGFFNFNAVNSGSIFSFDELHFENLNLKIPNQPKKWLDFDAQFLKLDINLSKVNATGFLTDFPLHFKRLIYVKDDPAATTEYGFLDIVSNKFKYGLVFELDLGSLGALVSKTSLKVDLLLGWYKNQYCIGIKFPNWTSGNINLGIEGVLKLETSDFQIKSENNRFALYANDTTLKIIDHPIKTKLFLLTGKEDHSQVGWYAKAGNTSDEFFAVAQKLALYGVSNSASTSDAVTQIGNLGDVSLSKILEAKDCEPTEQNKVAYCAKYDWTVAGRLKSIYHFLDVAFLFREPDLYGATLDAQLMPGLRISADILYNRISDSLGAYSLTLPLNQIFGGFPKLNFNLPWAGIKLYTSADFLFDLGYPTHGNFAHSFSLAVPPFMGAGGFKIGRIPSISKRNSSFLVGMGFKLSWHGEIDFSIVGGSLDVGIYALLEFEMQRASFDWSGTIGVQGHIAGHISLGIVSGDASLSIDAHVSYNSRRRVLTFETTIKGKASITIGVGSCKKTIRFHYSFGFSYSWDLASGNNSQRLISQAPFKFEPKPNPGDGPVEASLVFVPHISWQATSSTTANTLLKCTPVGVGLPGIILESDNKAFESKTKEIYQRITTLLLSTLDDSISKSDIKLLVMYVQDDSSNNALTYSKLRNILNDNFRFTIEDVPNDKGNGEQWDYQLATFPMTPCFIFEPDPAIYNCMQRTQTIAGQQWYQDSLELINKQIYPQRYLGKSPEPIKLSPRFNEARTQEELLIGYFRSLMLDPLQKILNIFHEREKTLGNSDNSKLEQIKIPKPEIITKLQALTKAEIDAAFNYAGRTLTGGHRPNIIKGSYEEANLQFEIPDIAMSKGLHLSATCHCKEDPKGNIWCRLSDDIRVKGINIPKDSIPSFDRVRDESRSDYWYPANGDILTCSPDSATKISAFYLKKNPEFKASRIFNTPGKIVFTLPLDLAELLTISDRQLASSISNCQQASWITVAYKKSEGEVYNLSSMSENNRIQLDCLLNTKSTQFKIEAFKSIGSTSTTPSPIEITRLIRCNTSTDSNPPPTALSANKTYPYSATPEPEQSLDFIKVLYALGVVNSSGFYLLENRTTASGARKPKATPAATTENKEEGQIHFLITASQGINNQELKTLSRGHNCIVFDAEPSDEVKDENNDLKLTLARDKDIADWTPICDTSNFPITVERDQPKPWKFSKDNPKEGKVMENKGFLQDMYSLLGCEIIENEWFDYFFNIIPSFPQPAADKEKQRYFISLPLQARSKANSNGTLITKWTTTNGNTAESIDPYFQLGQKLQFRLKYRDIFGNELKDDNNIVPISEVELLYRDQLIPPSSWPGVRMGYRFALSFGRPTMELLLDFSPKLLTPQALEAANSQLERIYWQLKERSKFGPEVFIKSSLHKNPFNDASISADTRSFITSILFSRDSNGNLVRNESPKASSKTIICDLSNNSVNEMDLEQIIVQLFIRRPDESVDHLLAGKADESENASLNYVTSIRSVSSTIPAVNAIMPISEGEPGTQNSKLDLIAFAKTFEQCYRTYNFVIATGHSDAGGNELWKVSSTLFPKPLNITPKFFAQKPIFQHPWTGISNEVNVVNSDSEAILNNVIDLTEQLLAPKNISGLYESLKNDADHILDAKVDLATGLAERSSYLFDTKDPKIDDRIQSWLVKRAKHHYRQHLLKDLRNAYKTDCVTQIYFETKVPNVVDQNIPPRFYGQIKTLNGASESSDKYVTIATARMTMGNAQATTGNSNTSISSLEFIAPTVDKTGKPNQTLTLVYEISHIEHKILVDKRSTDTGNDADIDTEDIFVNSSWLKLINPHVISFDRPGLFPNGIVIPGPSRHIPLSPLFLSHNKTANFESTKETKNTPIGKMLKEATTWTYEVNLEKELRLRDKLQAGIILRSDHLDVDAFDYETDDSLARRLHDLWYTHKDLSNPSKKQFDAYIEDLKQFATNLKSSRTNSRSLDKEVDKYRFTLHHTYKGHNSEVLNFSLQEDTLQANTLEICMPNLTDSTFKAAPEENSKQFAYEIKNFASNKNSDKASYLLKLRDLNLINHNVADFSAIIERNSDLMPSESFKIEKEHLTYSSPISTPTSLVSDLDIDKITWICEPGSEKKSIKDHVYEAMKLIFDNPDNKEDRRYKENLDSTKWLIQCTWTNDHYQLKPEETTASDGQTVEFCHSNPTCQIPAVLISPFKFGEILASEMYDNSRLLPNKEDGAFIEMQLTIFRNSRIGAVLLNLHRLRLPMNAIDWSHNKLTKRKGPVKKQ